MNTTTKFGTLLIAFVLCVPAVAGQQKEKDPRVQPVTPLPPIGADESSSAFPSRTGTEGSSNPSAVTGVQRGFAGSSAGRSFFLPSFSIFAGGDTNPQGFGANSELASVTTAGGQFAFQRIWPAHELVAEYAGSGTFHSSSVISPRNRYYQNLRLAHRTSGRNWSLLLSDVVDYSPEGGYAGGLGSGRLGPQPGSVSGNPLVGLDSSIQPNQSVLTTAVRRLSNTVVGEFQRTTGRRSTVTFSGSYGILRFIDGNLQDGNTIGFQAGYSLTATARDTIGVSYRGNIFQFTGLDRGNESHAAMLTYGRMMTGRLSFRIGAGPQFTRAETVVGPTQSFVSWSLDTSLRYRLRPFDMSLGYFHGVSGGSGVYLGSETDQVTVSLSRQLSRLWHGSANFAFARNGSLEDAVLAQPQSSFDSWQAGFQVSRPLGRHASLYFNYNFQRQLANGISATCAGSNCLLLGTRHQFGLGFNFRLKSIELD